MSLCSACVFRRRLRSLPEADQFSEAANRELAVHKNAIRQAQHGVI